MRVRNATKSVDLGANVDSAEDSQSRRRGLLGRGELAPGQGLWIAPCEAIHTFGMQFAIDVVFLNRKRKIVKVRKEMPRRRLSMCLRAYSVLELPAGTLDRTGTETGDQLEFIK